ncbi:PEP-CTERM sorting domain-containing protein [Poriferisphaera sp. WC338]|uniref:PEP-CTERM sorting domain-containing protein n=1 Tax=Poriferisphaera sp. WC338 TaxID=3425129 RepID=UPI003D819F43
MLVRRFFSFIFVVAVLYATTPLAEANPIISVEEDVMTSGFFGGDNRVRGYSGDNRNVHRVSNNNPFGTAAAETIYLTFDSNNFASLTQPVSQALLYVTSAVGGFNNDASAGNPFTVSAHALSADPITSITDDTNATGPIDWITFFDNNILAADPAAITAVDSFGQITFDVTSIVNDWISGANTVFAIALTGKNHVNTGADFLHGFLNNTENSGASYLVIPEPASLSLMLIGGLLIAKRKRK